MTSSHTTTSIQKKLLSLGNSEIAEHSQRFFKTGPGEYGEGDLFLGIRVPILRSQVNTYKNISKKELLVSLRSKYHEERLLALLIMVKLFQDGDEEKKGEIYQLYLKNTKYINGWDLVDCSAHHIVGPFLEHQSKKQLYQLSKSKSLWERRISIIACFAYIKKSDFKDAIAISEALLKDTEDLIHKAVGWMLREMGKRNLKTETNFLKKHYHNMPRVMLRYAIEKFPKSEREKYLKGLI